MQFSRREVLKGMGAAGITPLLVSACSSSGGEAAPMLPDLPEGVILWTRITPEASGPVEVWWEMALDEEFLERTAQGTFMTDASRDYTVKVDVPGLIWGRNYFYRFANQGRELSRKLEYGALADIVMLDTRIEGREQQLPALVFPPMSRPCQATSSAAARRPGSNRSSMAAKPNGESSAIRSSWAFGSSPTPMVAR